jgi:hypothetical protein
MHKCHCEKALALVNEMRQEHNLAPLCNLGLMDYTAHEAICRAIEQHEAFKQEVSDAVVLEYRYAEFTPKSLQCFIIPKPKPDPLVEATLQVFPDNPFAKEHSERIRAALDALGFEIREKDA